MLTLVLGLGFPGAVLAGPLKDARDDLREARQDLRQERKSVMEDMREKFQERTQTIRNFLGVGKAVIGSGKLTAKSDTTLTVEKDGKSYTVNFDQNTQLRRRFWGKAELAEFSVGNTVNVIGHWTDDTHTAINAKLIRNLSIQKRWGVFFGEVKSLLGSGWVMTTKSDNRADQTVTVTGTTQFKNRNGETITQADVKVGHKVRVRGLWDRSLHTVTEVSDVKDFSLPPVPTATVTVTATVTPTP